MPPSAADRRSVRGLWGDRRRPRPVPGGLGPGRDEVVPGGEPHEGAEAHAAVARRRVSRWGVGQGTAGASMLRCRPREAGSSFDALAFDGAVDRRAADAEELGDFEGAVLATVHQGDQVRLLATVEL